MFSNKILLLRINLNSILCRYKRRVANPGIENRLKFIQDKNEHDFEDDNFDYEFNVNETRDLFRQHKHELQQQKEKVQLLITREKYFKDRRPSFLTWQEKENIKYLYNLNPDENTPEKLSQNFPALPETIRKIVKTKWRPQSTRRIEIYNEKVKRNWNDFLTNKLQLSRELSEHLQKFSSTHKNIENIANINKTTIVLEKTPAIRSLARTDFQDILKIGKRDSANNNSVETTDLTICKEITSNRSSQKSIVREKLQKFVNIEKKTEMNSVTKSPKLTTSINLSNTNSDIDDIPERIEIPRKYWEKGKIYKLSDCYYDDDGEFLYRVPGMK